MIDYPNAQDLEDILLPSPEELTSLPDDMGTDYGGPDEEPPVDD
jgi:hypothetical protein